MEIMEFEKMVKSRRSIRRWKPDPVPENLILKALDLAIWAPNGGNHQNWRFIVVSDRKQIEAMANSVQAKADLMVSWPESSQFLDEVVRYQANASFWRSAPVCIAVLTAEYQSVADQILKIRVKKDPSVQPIIDARQMVNSGLQSASAAVAHMLLALHVEGLGGIWLTGCTVAKNEIESLLQIPEGFNLVAMIAVGFPDEQPKKTRKPLAEVVLYGKG
jgi:nitroreductase